MSATLRVILFVLAVVTAWWILSKIRRLKVKMEDAIFWIFVAVVLCVLSLFPEIVYKLTDIVGVMSPANLVFLIVIFILLEKVFTLSIIVSQLEEKVTVLSSEVALRSHSANRGIGIVEEEEKELYEETAAAREVQGELEETECQKGKKV